MIKAIVRCTVCANKRLAEVETQTIEAMLLFKLPSLLIACHAATPHCPHELSFEFEGVPIKLKSEEKALTLKCLFPSCAKANTIMETSCPKEMVTALTICFHSAHEGHPMEIVYDGRAWRSPLPPTAKGRK